MQKKPRAKKSLGQNFLIDPNYQRKIITAIKTNYSNETILEIGPGWGAITKHLLEFAKDLILIEKDHLLASKLQESFLCHSHLTVVNEDFLEWQIPDCKEVIVVANLPYNVASQILIKLFKERHKFKRLYLMFQKEMADRCLAKTHTKNYSMLTVWTKLFSQPKKLFDLPGTAFQPRPKVVSSFLQFDVLGRDYLEEKEFIEFVKKLFLFRRKKVSTILKKEIKDLSCLDTDVMHLIDNRVEALTIAQMKKVFFYYYKRN